MVYQVDTTIPQMAFAPFGPRGRTSLGATEHVIELACSLLQVTKYQLAYLLGISPSHLYRWLNGSSSPSYFYMTRLSQLELFHIQGVPVANMTRILWEESLILWKDGSVTCEVGQQTRLPANGALHKRRCPQTGRFTNAAAHKQSPATVPRNKTIEMRS